MADIFLSYKKADRERVSQLAADLQADGFSVWWDYALESGDKWFERILEEVQASRCLVGCWTKSALGPNRLFTASEKDGHNYLRIEHETAGRAKIAGVLLDAECVPLQYEDLQFSNLTDWAPGNRQHPGYRDLVKRVTELATPAFVYRAVADAEADRRATSEQLKSARVRGDGLEEQLTAKISEIAGFKERADDDRRGYVSRIEAAEADSRKVREELAALRSEAESGKQHKAAARGMRVGLLVTAAMALLAAGGAAGWYGNEMAPRAQEMVATLVGKPEPPAPTIRLAPNEPADVQAPVVDPLGAARLPPLAMFRDCADCPEMVVLSGGRFEMGSEGDPEGRIWPSIVGVAYPRDQFPRRVVDVPPFAIGRFEVTSAEYAQCVQDYGCPQAPTPTPRHPVVGVTWGQANAYVDWLNKKTGQKYALPYEAEWEFAARVGKRGWQFGFGDDYEQACSYGNFADKTHKDQGGANQLVSACSDGVGDAAAPVGSYKANLWGLFDMHGNVWEWARDCFSAYTPIDKPSFAQATNDVQPCTQHVMRGGSYSSPPQWIRSAMRMERKNDQPSLQVGFRVARALPPTPPT